MGTKLHDVFMKTTSTLCSVSRLVAYMMARISITTENPKFSPDMAQVMSIHYLVQQ